MDELQAAVQADDGTRLYLHYRLARSPLAVVMCDGIICDGFIYKYLWDDLSDVASVAHFHYRGHGRSALPTDPERIGIEDFARDLNSVRYALGDPEVVLMGHSVGTQVCLEAYRLRPDKVRGIVLLCGSYGRVTHTFHGTDLLAQVLPRIIDFIEGNPRLVRAFWARVPPRLAVKIATLLGEVDGHAITPEDMEPYFEHLAHVDPKLFVRMLERAGEHSAEDMLANIQVPVLVIAGDKDSFTPSELSRSMAEQIPGSELLLIPGGTHVTPLEHRRIVGEHVRAFVERVGAAAATGPT